MEIKEIQNRLLEMGKAITTILENHDIPYMITFGTLLGAVRHKGFIPWDDDFDLFLFDDTYDKAAKCLKEELLDDMFFEYLDSEPLYFHNFAHVKDLGTVVSCKQYPQDSAYKHKGLSIDLYRAKRMPESELDEYLIKEHLMYLQRRYKSGWLSKEILTNKTQELEQKLANLPEVESDNEVLGFALVERQMAIEDVFPLKKYAFEDTFFYGPNDSNSILTKFYGDYMCLPPENQRVPHYSSVERI